MNRYIVIVIGLLIMATAAAYFYLSGKEYVIRIPEIQIQHKLSDKLPITKTYWLIFSVTLDNPRVDLIEENGRVKAGLDITLNIKIGKLKQPLEGSVDASGQLKYEPTNGQFYLADLVIERLDLQGVPDKHINKVSKAVSKALSEYYSTHPVYTLKSSDVKQAAAKLVLKNIIVDRDELVVTLGF